MAAPKLIVIAGQTASGKSAMAIELAKKFNGEVICADSRTVYRYMDIGTAKPNKDERTQIKHHLLDLIEPDKRFNASSFKRLASEAIKDIASRGKIPFMAGGTGLYISSVVYDYDFESDGDNSLRENCLMLGIKPEKDELRRRIKDRVDKMIDSGMENEVRNLVAQYGFDAPGMNAICYKEWRPVFAGEQTIYDLKQKLYTNNWQYAKRQNTWFKRDKNIRWVTSVEQASVLAQQFLIQ